MTLLLQVVSKPQVRQEGAKPVPNWSGSIKPRALKAV